MKRLKNTLFALFALCMVGADYVVAQDTRSSAEILKQIETVNDYWQAHNTPYCRAFWDNAAYFTGNMEAYKMTGKAAYLDYSSKWCYHNQWKGAQSDDKRNWKYKTYGEGHDFVLFGDWQICFQTYIDMYMLNPDEFKVARAKEVMSYACHMDENKFWWWSDALYMVMPVMTKMYKLTGDEMYLDRLYENFLWSDSLMFDAEAQLYYRDAKYIYPKVKTACGGKSFWARGDGWVLAGLAKVLADMPKDYRHRDIFVERFRQLAQGVARCQQDAGYWSRSMLCEKDAPGPETSGTAFFTYGFLWGVNNGLLDRATYAPVIEKAWRYLQNVALQPDGSIGYVQPIGEKPDPTKTVNAQSQAPFGTGAWLLAACEMVRYLDGTVGDFKSAMTVEISNPTARMRREVIEIDAATVFGKLGIGGGRQFIVRDAYGMEQPYQLTYDGKVLVEVNVRPGATSTITFEKGSPSVFRNVAYGRIYPNRLDDLAWENDKTAFRAYGPQLQKQNQQAFGFDVFAKNQPYTVLEQLYDNELRSYAIHDRLRKQGRGNECDGITRLMSYHLDHGHGMDAYTVGATLGAGTPALMEGDKFIMPWCWKEAQILDNGPLRFTARLVYHPMKVGNDTNVVETRVISLDKGSHMNKCEVTYEGLSVPAKAAAGIVVHGSDAKSYALNKKKGYVAYADAMDHPEMMNGQLYVGCLFPTAQSVKYIPLEKETAGGIGHVAGIEKYEPGSTFAYYFGTAWSKYDVPDFGVWQQLLTNYSDDLKTPLKVIVK